MFDDSFGGDLLGTLFLGGMFFLVDRAARSSTIKQIKEDIESLEIQRLREEVERLKRERN